MTKYKISRKKLLKEPDEFITTTGKILRFVKTYKTHCLYGAVAFFAIILTAAIVRYVSENNEKKAAVMLDEALQKYETVLQNNSPEKAMAEVQETFEVILDKYVGKAAGKIAAVKFGDICYRAGDADQAIKYYNRGFDAFKGTSMAPIVINGLAYASELKKDYQGAVTYFQKLVSDTDSEMAGTALFNIGRLYELMGESEKSAEAFRKIASDYPDTIYAELAKEKISG